MKCLRLTWGSTVNILCFKLYNLKGLSFHCCHSKKTEGNLDNAHRRTISLTISALWRNIDAQRHIASVSLHPFFHIGPIFVDCKIIWNNVHLIESWRIYHNLPSHPHYYPTLFLFCCCYYKIIKFVVFIT